MRQSRAWRIDVAACLLLLAGLLAGVAVATYDPIDAPGAISPPPERVNNPLGLPGAWVGHEIVSALGLAAWPLLAAWLNLVLLLFCRRDWTRWSVRLLGWLLLTAAL